MAKLVNTLESQHRLLERMVGQIDAAIRERNPGALGLHLRSLHDAFLAHVTLENRDFYPVFDVARGATEDHRQVARLFATNMRLIAEGLNAFFARHLDKPIELATFEREWRPVVQTLSQRIASEEHTLHPIFNRLVGVTP